MSRFPKPQHKFAPARDSGTFGSIIKDPYMVTLDPPFLYLENPGMEGEDFFCSGFFNGLINF